METIQQVASQYSSGFVVWLIDFIPNLVKGLVIAFITWHAGRLTKRFVNRSARRLGGDEILWNYLGTLLRYLVVAVGFIEAMRKAGLPVDALLATFGISGVIIGLGARASIANYFAGIMMLAARPFKQGDLIEFGPPPQIGRVTEVKMTYTGLVTLDNVRVIVPNSVMWRNKIINFSSFAQRAIRIPISIPYDVDVDWVEDLALDVLGRHPAVLDDPIHRLRCHRHRCQGPARSLEPGGDHEDLRRCHHPNAQGIHRRQPGGHRAGQGHRPEAGGIEP